jgi:hypothetical protein
VKRNFASNLGPPYSECINNIDDIVGTDVHDIFVRTNKTYRQRDCFNYEIQKMNFNKNGCVLNNQINIQYLENIKYCYSHIGYEYVDMTQFDEFLYKKCRPECYSMDFVSSLSTSSSTSVKNMSNLIDLFKIAHSFVNDVSSIKSVYSINIYYSELDYTEIGEIPNYPAINLISNIGGTLGLFLGMSLLSLFEIVEFFIQISMIAIKPKQSNQIDNSMIINL